MTLELPDTHRESIVDRARDEAPKEVVGILAGQRGDDSVVERTYAAKNAAKTPHSRYEIAPHEQIELLDRIDEAGLDVVGFYHSHPDGPAKPSAVDAQLASWPGYLYVIVSLDGESATFGGWRWSGERFDPEPIRSS